MNNFCNNGSCQQSQQTQQSQQSHQTEHTPACDCPCEKDLHRALELLCSPQLQPLIDFDAFAFVSSFYILGSAITTLTVGAAPSDNLDDPAGTYSCSGSNCSTAAVSGDLFAPIGGEPIETSVSLVSLCSLSAVAFDAADEDTNGTQAENFQSIRQLLSQILHPQKSHEECPREGSLLDSLTSAAQQTVSLAVGPLLLQNAAVLGEIGNVLVLANSSDYRFYFVCANSIDFIG